MQSNNWGILAFLSSLFTRKASSQSQAMATTHSPIANNPNTKQTDKSKSRFLPTECLTDWWLAKAEDEKQGTILAVSGQSLAGKQPRRFCSSLPILKRHDVFTLETTDGKTVVLKGFLNKDRSIENGFPSHVCDHFMFGFPDYWKTCTQPYMVIEPSVDMSPPKSGSVIRDPEKKSHKINNLDGVHDSPSKDNFGRGITSSEEISVHTKKKSRTCSVSELGKDTTSSEAEGISIHTTKKARTRSMSKFGNGMSSLVAISSDTKIKARRRSMSKCDRGMISSKKISSDIKNQAVTRSRSSLEMKQMNGQASVVLDSPLKDQLDRGMTSPEEFSSHSKNKARTRSLSRSEIEQKNSKASVAHSDGEKTRLKPIALSLDFDKVELAHGESNLEVNNDLHAEDNTRLNESVNDKMNSSELGDACSVEQIPEISNLEDELKRIGTRGVIKQMSRSSKPISDRKSSPKTKAPHISETLNLEKDMKRVQPRGLVKQKSKSKATPSLSKSVSARKSSLKAKSAKASHLSETSNPGKDLERVQTRGSKATPSLTKPISDKRSLSENAKAPSTKRKLAYKTPKREKKKKRAPVDSPQLSGLKRSRSGRLLTPRLEFWRNQRTICNADGTVTGIKLDMQPEQPITGSETTSRRKRRQQK